MKKTLALAAAMSICGLVPAAVLEREARDTLTPVELDAGDTLRFRLRNGAVRTLTLEDTAASVLFTTIKEPKKAELGGGTLYHFTARVTVDGHPMTFERYVGSQESFYEPYVVDGMRIWFDAVLNIGDFLTEMHGEWKPSKQARFAVADAADRICPPVLKPWYPNPGLFIDAADCYNGDDMWMGPYFGADAHGGLDVNVPKGTPGWAPIDFDDHYLFHSVLKPADNNNRWRGIRKWPNGDVWALQNHHLYQLLVPEHVPIKAGTLYAANAGTHVGSHEHAHFQFKAATPANGREVLLDPWILFWQTFEDARDRMGLIRARMTPLSPARTGEPVRFDAAGSRAGSVGGKLFHFWVFGDGGSAAGAAPVHVFARAGVYPVTLTIFDGAEYRSHTQHITVNGAPVRKPVFRLSAPDEPGFRPRPLQAMDVYNVPLSRFPQSLEFLARPSRPVPDARKILLEDAAGRGLPSPPVVSPEYWEGKGWLRTRVEGKELSVGVDGTDLTPGQYQALVHVDCAGAVNSRQSFLVRLTIPSYPPRHRENRDFQREVVDDADHLGFYATPWFWVGHKFHGVKDKGFRGFSLTNGGRPVAREFARFTPDLEAGRYLVSFAAETPFSPDSRFQVRIRHKSGEEKRWVRPPMSRDIGEFDFEEGMDGFAEVLAEGSTGQVLADALVFRRLEPAPAGPAGQIPGKP